MSEMSQGPTFRNMKFHFPATLCPTAQDKNMQACCMINIPVYSVHFLKETPTIFDIFKCDNYIQISDTKPAECPRNCRDVNVLQNCWQVASKKTADKKHVN